MNKSDKSHDGDRDGKTVGAEEPYADIRFPRRYR